MSNIIDSKNPVSITFKTSEEQKPLFCGFRESIAVDWKNDSTCQLEVHGNQSTCRCDEFGQITLFSISVYSESSSSSINSESKKFPVVAVILPVIIFIVVMGIVVITVIARKRRRNTKQNNIEMKENSYLIINNAEISEPIGSGNFGTVYKGFAFGGTAVALKYMEGATKEDLLAEISILAKVHHVRVFLFYSFSNFQI